MADSFSSFDVARLAFDGADTGTTFTDQLGHTFTANGAGATTSTVQMKYGTASGLFSGVSTAYLNSATTVDWNLGSGNFCVDVWIYPTSLANTESLIMSIANGSGTPNISLSVTSAGAVKATIIVGGVTKTLTSETGAIVVNRWQHIALTRTSGTARLFHGGSVRATDATLSTTAVDFNSDSLNIGGSAGAGATGSFIGNIDMFRLTKGHARYSGPYIPPLPDFNTLGTNTVTTSLGTYTRQVSFTGEFYHDAVISACNEAIQALGWTLFDVKYQKGGGEVTTVYRSLNKDGVTYKIALLIWNKHMGSVCFTSCESWNTTSQTITNECWNAGRESNRITYFLNGTDIIIFGSARWLGMMSYIQNSPGHSNFVFEFEREAPEDTSGAGYPCWGTWCSEWSYNYSVGAQGSTNFAMPRYRSGQVGGAAADRQVVMTSTNAYGVVGCTSKFIEWNNSTRSSGLNKSAWDSSKRLVTDAKLVGHSTLVAATNEVNTYGRIFGYKLLPPQIGNQFDKIVIKTDSDLFVSGTGTDTDHWLLAPAILNSTSITTHSTYTPTTNSYTATGASGWQTVIYTGTVVYAATASGIRKFVPTTNTHSIVANSGVNVYDIAYDGRYVYGTTSTGITRVDTSNADATSSLTIGTGGTASICWDGSSRLFVSQRTNSTTPSLYCVDTGSFTQLGSTMTLSSGRTTASWVQGFSSNAVDKVLGVYYNTTTAADAYQVLIDTNAITATWGTSSDNTNALTGTTKYLGKFWAIGRASGPSGSYQVYTYFGDGSWSAATDYWGITHWTYGQGGTGVGFTVLNPSRLTMHRSMSCSYLFIPASNAAEKSTIMHNGGIGYVQYVSSQNLANFSIGSFTSAISVRGSFMCDNICIFMDNNLVPYIVKDFLPNNGFHNGIYYGQIAIPK